MRYLIAEGRAPHDRETNGKFRADLPVTRDNHTSSTLDMEDSITHELNTHPERSGPRPKRPPRVGRGETQETWGSLATTPLATEDPNSRRQKHARLAMGGNPQQRQGEKTKEIRADAVDLREKHNHSTPGMEDLRTPGASGKDGTQSTWRAPAQPGP